VRGEGKKESETLIIGEKEEEECESEKLKDGSRSIVEERGCSCRGTPCSGTSTFSSR